MSTTNDPTAKRMVEQNDPDAALTAALQRLEASRQSMRQVMIPPPRRSRAQRAAEAQASGEQTPAPETDFWSFVPDSLRDGADQLGRLLRKHPISSMVVDAVGDWWRRHPVRAAASVAGSEVAHAAGPLIRRYPVASVGLAAGLGAALVICKPWQWRAFGGSTRPVHRRVTSWLLAQVPLQAAIGTLIALLADQARQAASKPRADAASDRPDGSAADSTQSM